MSRKLLMPHCGINIQLENFFLGHFKDSEVLHFGLRVLKNKIKNFFLIKCIFTSILRYGALKSDHAFRTCKISMFYIRRPSLSTS